MKKLMIILLLGCLSPGLAQAATGFTLYPVVDVSVQKKMPPHYGQILGSHDLSLEWESVAKAKVASYQIIGSRLPGLDRQDRVWAEVDDPQATSTDVHGLMVGTTYYFKVVCLDQDESVLMESNEIKATTAANAYPWSDNLEGSLSGWDTAGSQWALTDSWSSSPTHSFTDSPDSNYQNSTGRNLLTAVNLMTAIKPVLQFKQYYNIQADGDFGQVAVSTDGGANWAVIDAVTGSSGAWVTERIDLSPYRGNLNLLIRWRLSANAGGVSDGWYLDDVSVTETPYPVLALPLYDTVNTAAHSDSLWFDAAWQRLAGGEGPGYYFDDSPLTGIPEYLTTALTLVNDVDLAGSSHPWLVFQHKVDLDFQNFAKVEASLDGGANWTVLKTWTGPYQLEDWTQAIVDLSDFAGGPVRLRFHLENQGVNAGGGWEIDKVQIEDLSQTLALTLTANNYDRADLSWTPYAGGDFGSYEIYRSLTGSFLLDQEQVGVITSSGTSTLQDTVDPGTTYYYQVFVTDPEGRYLTSSQILQRPAYALPAMAYPYTTDLESGASEFQAQDTWAVTAEMAHSGSLSWSDSPGGNYPNNSQSNLMMKVDLAGGAANRPALVFWQQYGFETNQDWGYVDVSTDGGTSFVPIYCVTGNSGGWQQAFIDLTTYRGQVLNLRWRVASGSSGQADGWHLDDITLAENTKQVPVYPLVDDFNNSTATGDQWLAGSFSLASPSDNGSPYWTNRPTGSMADLYPGYTSLVLGRPADLSAAVNPQLRFRYRAYDSDYNSADTYIQVSTDGGDTWVSLMHLGNAPAWTIAQVDMGTYGGASSVLLRVYCLDGNSGGTNPWCDIEDLTLTDQPGDVVLSVTDNQPYQVSLGWTQNTEPDFDRYVIKVGSTPGLTLSSTTLVEIDQSGIVSYTHTGLAPYDARYYKVFVYDDLGLYSDGSNEVARPALNPPLLAYPFSDDLEGGAGNFLADLPWALSSETAHSGSFSWSDSPGENYQNSLTRSVAFRLDLNGGTAVRPELSFWHQYGLQTGGDYGYVDVSTDGGVSYDPIYYLTGTSGQWRHARVDLTPYRGQVLNMRFRIKTDGSVQDDGWHIDDIAVTESTLPGMVFPVAEDFNDSLTVMGHWVPGGFGLAQPGRDGSPYMTDRPTGFLPDFYPGSTVLALGGDLDLSGTSHPQIHLWYRAYDNPYNSAQTYLQISQDGGETWDTLRQFPNTPDWTEAQIDIQTYVSPVPVQLRFNAYDGASGSTNPWFDLDDFTITETPADAAIALIDNQPYQATVAWPAAPGAGFGSYILKYGTAPGLTLASSTLATLSAATDTTFVHAGLSPYDTYYYKLFVKDATGLISDGSNEVMRGPLAPPLLAYPFFDDMEGGGGNFLTESPWDITQETAHGGGSSWSDSPNDNYANNKSSSLVMRVDLAGGGADRPVLTFWQRYGFELNADWGYVDVSTDGGSSWIPVFSVTGTSGSWVKAEIDLTDYRGQVLQLRFRVKTGSSGQADGWHLDDIALAEQAPGLVATPFFDDVNDTTVTGDNWIAGGFGLAAPSVNGTTYWSNRSTGGTADLYPGGKQMVLRGALDLAAAVAPQLSFSYRGYDSPYNSADNFVQVSQDGGATWITVKQLGSASDWTFQQLDMSGYVSGVPTLLRFYSRDWENGGTNPYLDLENIRISEKPNDVTLALADNQAYQISLAWNQPTVPGGFAAYEIKRGTQPGLTANSTTLAVITAPEDTTFTDTGLSPNDVFYYKVFVRDQATLLSNGSNEVGRGTVAPPLLAYPFNDDLESGGGNFGAELPWALTQETAHSGVSSWSDSPYANYANNLGLSLTLRIDMSAGTAQFPELVFWHQYGFQTNVDWGRVEVSTDAGVSWEGIAYVTGSSGFWQRKRVDLTAYRSQVLWLRFRVTSDGSGQADGWHLDDISIAESPNLAKSYPFYDTFDDSASTAASWIFGGFGLQAPSEDGSPFLTDRSTGSMPDINPGGTMLALDGAMDLSAAVEPILRFRYRAYNNSYNSAQSYVQISNDGGANWTSLVQLSLANDWSTVELPLDGYQGGDPIRVRVQANDGAGGSANPTCDVENFAITENWQTTPMADFCRLDYPQQIWLTAGQTSSVIISRVFEPGVTDASGQGAGVTAQLGWGPHGTLPTDPTAGWVFSQATYAGDADGATVDLYQGNLVAGAVGEYDYCFRYSLDGGGFWSYADRNGNDLGQGGFNYYQRAQAGQLVVTVAPALTISDTSIVLTLPVGQTSSRVLTLGNEGVGPLVFQAVESTAPPVPAEVTWLGVSPVTGTVVPRGFQQLAFAIDGTNLSEGDYNATVMLYTNDPLHARLDLPVTVHVVAPSEPHLSGTVLDVDFNVPSGNAFVEVYDGATLVGQGTVGGNGYFSLFGIAAGDYQLRAHGEGYYPVMVAVTVPDDDIALVLHRIPAFAPTSTSVNFYGQLSYLDGALLRPGDVVTVQDPQGIVCGATMVQVAGSYGFLHAYGDDATTPETDEGAAPGDTLTFRVNGELAFTMGPDSPVWTSDGDVRQVEFSAVSVTEDKVPLQQGWNLISFNRVPDDASVESELGELMTSGHLVIAYGFDQQWGGAVTYDPLHPELSDLATMDAEHGYWLKVTDPDTLVVPGVMYWPDNALPLEAGWNLTSYLPEENRDIQRALGSLAGDFSLVSGFDGGAVTYDPAHPEFSTLDALKSGFGYWIKMNFSADLIYDQGAAKHGHQAKDEGITLALTPTPWWDSYYGSANMLGVPLMVGDTISAMDPDGVVCGSFVCRQQGIYGYMPIYGDDPLTPEDEGAVPGDRIIFTYPGAGGMITPPDMTWRGDQSLVEFNLMFVSGVPGSGVPEKFQVLGAHPNPFNPATVIRYDLPATAQVEAAIYDVTGRLVARILNETQEPGRKEVRWNGVDTSGKSVASGLYFCRIKAGDQVGLTKMLLMK